MNGYLKALQPSNLFTQAWLFIRRRLGLYGLAMILILELAMMALINGLGGVVGGLGPWASLFTWFSLFGILAAWRMGGREKWLFRTAFWILAGAFVLFIQTAGLWDELLQVTRSGLGYLAAFLRFRLDDTATAIQPSMEPLLIAWLKFSDIARIHADIIATWLQDVFKGQSTYQAEAVTFSWGVLLWLISLFSGLVLCQTGNVLLANLPAGMVLSMALAWSHTDKVGSLAIFLLAVLLMSAVRTQYLNERRWLRKLMDYPEDMRVDFLIAAAVLVSVIVVMAYALPSANLGSRFRSWIERAREPAGTAAIQEPGFGESVGLPRPTSVPPFFDQYQDGSLPRSHLLGAGPEVTGQVMLKIRVFGVEHPEDERFYWRALTYDVYNSAGWNTGAVDSRHYGAGDTVPYPELTYSRFIRQEVEVIRPQGQIAFGAGDILSIDEAFTVAWHTDRGEDLDPFGVRQASEKYQVDTRSPLDLSDRLRTAGTDYPEWVSGSYLALPESLPDRVVELANRIATFDNAYDNAVAIEQYLRHFEYTLDLGPPPRDRDVVDYFIFDLQRGYCDYFASAMVVMARSVGLPARLAIGYAVGEYDPDTDKYILTALNAHSWPEIYFPDFGWVTFEPTSGLSEIERINGFDLPVLPEANLPAFTTPQRGYAGLLLTGFAVVFLLMILAGAAWGIRESARMRRMSPDEFFSAAFQWLYGTGRGLGFAHPPQPTPREYSRALAGFLDEIAEKSRLVQRLNVNDLAIEHLTTPYLRSQYALKGPDDSEKQAAIRTWWKLRIAVGVAKVYVWLQRRMDPSGRTESRKSAVNS